MKQQRLVVLVAVVFAVAVASFAYLGSFSRMMADDYCTARDGLEYGAIGTALYTFETWSGALVNFVLKGAAAPFQPAFHSVQTALLIVLLGVSVWAMLWQITAVLEVRLSRLGWGVLVLFFVFLMVYATPQPRNVYWFSTLIPYSYPVALFFVQVALLVWVLRQERGRGVQVGVALLWGLLAWLLSSVSQTFSTSLVPVYVLGGVWAWWRLPAERRPVLMAVLMAGMVGLLIGLAIVVASPGNAARQAQTFATSGHTTPDLITLVFITLSISIQYVLLPNGLGYLMFAFFGMLVLLNLSPLRLADLPTGRTRLDALFALGLTALVILATVAPSAYGTGIASPHIFFFPRVVQLACAVYLGYLVAVALARAGFPSAYLRRRPVYRLTRLALGGLLFFVPAFATVYNLGIATQAMQYAEDWDARHAYLLGQVAQGNTTGLVMPDYRYSLAEYMLVSEVNSKDGENVATRCIQKYYGVTEFTITPLETITP